MRGGENESALGAYYRALFPVALIARWLRYIRTREFSFTLANDIYIRYITVTAAEELASRICMDVPQKIDIGGVYVHKPASVTTNNQCIIKELVFDIDLTDYARTCCTDKNMCNACLPLIKCAVEVLSSVLAEDFGFRNILFVFSGGRGVHCWVSDAVAMALTGKDRTNIVEYFSALAKKNNEAVDKILMKYKDAMNMGDAVTMAQLYDRLLPKLDVNVTKQTKHLLKSPFCIHPRTGRVCVPIDPAKLDALVLESIPTLSDLLKNRESLSEYVEYFQAFVEEIE
ncbi:DNA primase small subunit [Nematocida minor]|uniref:DNA primase small subunit n=1 Tax=Nematocida minor TaxID=1912983 RepID=UPI00221F1537|nr:DNA primase small subunit [Nematocida minor]KAI5190227.1 DNA primase small subunit [Nematocida minor]